ALCQVNTDSSNLHSASSSQRLDTNPFPIWHSRCRSSRGRPFHSFKRDPPVRAFCLASAGGGGPVNLVSLGVLRSPHRSSHDGTQHAIRSRIHCNLHSCEGRKPATSHAACFR